MVIVSLAEAIRSNPAIRGMDIADTITGEDLQDFQKKAKDTLDKHESDIMAKKNRIF